jgi:hypothetical protein
MPSDRDPIAPGITERWIHKIIAEAVQRERDRIAEAVRGMKFQRVGSWNGANDELHPGTPVVDRAAVLAIVNGKEEVTG